MGDLNRGDGCTNSPDAIPSSWYQYPEFYLFESPQACKLPRPCLLVSCSFPRTDLSLIHLLFKGCSALFRDMPCAIHVDCLTSGGPTISDVRIVLSIVANMIAFQCRLRSCVVIYFIPRTTSQYRALVIRGTRTQFIRMVAQTLQMTYQQNGSVKRSIFRLQASVVAQASSAGSPAKCIKSVRIRLRL